MLKSVGCFPQFPERSWSVMTGSEVSHDVMTRPEADRGGDRRHCVSRPSPSSLWREGPTCSKDAVVTTLCVLFPDWPKLGHRVKDEEGVRGETGDHRGRDHGEHGHGGDNDGGRGSEQDCSLQCCRDQMCGVTSYHTPHTRFKLMHIE